MNLVDLCYEDLMKVKEVGLVLKDIAKYLIEVKKVYLEDRIIFQQEDAVVYVMNPSSIFLIENDDLLNNLSWGRECGYKLSFGVNYCKMMDTRGYSTRFSTEKRRVQIKVHDENKVICWNNKPRRSSLAQEKYLEPLPDIYDEAAFFQSSLIHTPDEMNALVLNFLFRNEVPETAHIYNFDYDVVFISNVTKLKTMLDAHKYIEQLRKLC